MNRGEIYWVKDQRFSGGGPDGSCPMLMVQADFLNQSRLPTAVFCVLSPDRRHVRMPGNMLLTSLETGLADDSVLLVTEMRTVDRSHVGQLAGRVPDHLMVSVDEAMREVLGL